MKDTDNIIWYDSLPSTQTKILEDDVFSLKEWTVVAAKNQTKGKGQNTNTWETEDNKNLTFSLLLKPVFIPIADQFRLTQILSLAICDYLSQYMKNVYIKWPNDIYVGENKICGILIQNSLLGSEFSVAVCGIGLNINQTNFLSAPNPTSMKIETKKEFEVEKALNDLLHHIYIRYKKAEEKQDQDYKKEYLNRLLFYKEWKKFIHFEHGKIEAMIEDVDELGYLILKKRDEERLIVELKQLKFIFKED